MEYIKKLPLLSALGVGLLLGMIFMYNKKTLSDVFGIWAGATAIFYFLGRILSETFIKIKDEQDRDKISQTKIDIKEGNDEKTSNIDRENVSGLRLDNKVDENFEESFVELKDLAARGKK